MTRERKLRFAILALLAPAGVMLGHAIAYALAIPDPHFRNIVLQNSGHGWWTTVLPMAMCMVIAGSLIVVYRSDALGRSQSEAWRGNRWVWLASRLAAVQIALFGAVEFGERLVMHGTVEDLLLHGILLQGIAVQAVVALVLTHLLWWLSLATVALWPGALALWEPVPAAEFGVVPPLVAPRGVSRTRQQGARAPPVALLSY